MLPAVTKGYLNFLNSLKNQSVKLSKRLPITELASTNTELHLTENPPEAIVCDSQGESMEFIPSHDREPMGISIINKPEEVSLNNNRVGFGIDFGTTNTNAYMQIE